MILSGMVTPNSIITFAGSGWLPYLFTVCSVFANAKLHFIAGKLHYDSQQHGEESLSSYLVLG